jgi:methylated-DNA-protein-cysteine methyltransferase related protein
VTSFTRRVEDVVRRLRPGDVVTYGEVATEAGSPGAARAVGNVLARGGDLPWWRVVPADGRLVPRLAEEQAQRLRAEGVEVREGRVVDPGRGAAGGGRGRSGGSQPPPQEHR